MCLLRILHRVFLHRVHISSFRALNILLIVAQKMYFALLSAVIQVVKVSLEWRVLGIFFVFSLQACTKQPPLNKFSLQGDNPVSCHREMCSAVPR